MDVTTMTTCTYITEYYSRFTRAHGLKLVLSIEEETKTLQWHALRTPSIVKFNKSLNLVWFK